MKILLVAYEFPPSPSPQALRWAYLARELHRLGHEIHVLTPDLGPGAEHMLPRLPGSIRIHRTYAGPMRGFIAWHRRRKLGATLAADGADAGATPSSETSPPEPRASRTPLKVKLVNLAFRISERVWFPDIRGEWRWFGMRAARRLTKAHRYDAILSSHEPATTLQIGLALARSGARWVADLGDPVLATYTPKRWRRRSLALERDVCRTADAVTVTAASASRLLVERHGAREPVVLTQGYAPREQTVLPPTTERLELAYAGSFYSFRRAEALFEAVVATPGTRLTIATVALPDSLRRIADAHPASFNLRGFLSHADALALQQSAHVLVNIANRDASQVPGKLYEYFGSHRPILHLTHGGEDPGAELIASLRRGWVVDDSTAALSVVLMRLRTALTEGRLTDGLDLSDETVAKYSWPAIGERLDRLLRSLAPR